MAAEKKQYEAALEAHACGHERRALRRRVVAGGTVHYVRQCVRCGNASNPVKSAVALLEAHGGEIEAFDESLEASYARERQSVYAKAVEGVSQESQELYEQYRNTEHWRRLRDLVVRRAKGVCEGCGERKATQVHHLTYRHIGAEFLWELVAVCEECHARAHVDDA